MELGRETPFVKFHGSAMRPKCKKTASKKDEKVTRSHKSTSLTICDLSKGLRLTKNGRRARGTWSRDGIFVKFHGSATRPKCKKHGAQKDEKITRLHESTSLTICDLANGLRLTKNGRRARGTWSRDAVCQISRLRDATEM